MKYDGDEAIKNNYRQQWIQLKRVCGYAGKGGRLRLAVVCDTNAYDTLLRAGE